jgi:hypothetical protein
MLRLGFAQPRRLVPRRKCPSRAVTTSPTSRMRAPRRLPEFYPFPLLQFWRKSSAAKAVDKHTIDSDPKIDSGVVLSR